MKLLYPIGITIKVLVFVVEWKYHIIILIGGKGNYE